MDIPGILASNPRPPETGTDAPVFCGEPVVTPDAPLGPATKEPPVDLLFPRLTLVITGAPVVTRLFDEPPKFCDPELAIPGAAPITLLKPTPEPVLRGNAIPPVPMLPAPMTVGDVPVLVWVKPLEAVPAMAGVVASPGGEPKLPRENVLSGVPGSGVSTKVTNDGIGAPAAGCTPLAEAEEAPGPKLKTPLELRGAGSVGNCKLLVAARR
jgi:hypothetical protein